MGSEEDNWQACRDWRPKSGGERMLDKEVVQQRGFRNAYQNGQAVGFQVGHRSTYYRGIWLSMS